MTGLCQRPIVHNRTRPVIPGAYWTVTGRCLHRVWSCDHRVRSSREKRISSFLTVRSDLVFPSKNPSQLRTLAVLAVISPPPPQSSAAAAEPPSMSAPERRRIQRLHSRARHQSRPPQPRKPPPPRPRARRSAAVAEPPRHCVPMLAVRAATACPRSLPERLRSRAAIAEQPRAPET
jgi:hypothetical protein